MDNYKAILNMNEASMEAFLDQVYLAGLNTGMYAGGFPIIVKSNVICWTGIHLIESGSVRMLRRRRFPWQLRMVMPII